MKAYTAWVTERKGRYVGAWGRTRGVAIEVERGDKEEQEKDKPKGKPREKPKDQPKEKPKDKEKSREKVQATRAQLSQ